MEHVFEVVESGASRLWDYGWFDQTRFRCSGDQAGTGEHLLAALVRAPIYSRSFCTQPDPWGASDDDHGPYRRRELLNQAFAPISHDDLVARVNAAMSDPAFIGRPDAHQLIPVKQWLDLACSPVMETFVLEPAGEARTQLAELNIWHIFHEFAAVDSKAREIRLAVIGYE